MGDHPFSLPMRAFEILRKASRLQAVKNTGLNETRTLDAFEDISSTAALLLKAPVAQVTLMDEFKQFIKSSAGYDIKEAPTATSFCAVAIAAEEDVTIVLDTLKDPVFKHSPFVVEPPHVRFYAGSPILFEGEKVGTVCIYDFEPRNHVSDENIEFLAKLANEAAAAIEESQIHP